MKSSNHHDKTRPVMPEFYMPAMWPLDLQNAIVDWIGAWFWRRRMRRLLAQEHRGPNPPGRRPWRGRAGGG
jgi:hypothetical protein